MKMLQERNGCRTQARSSLLHALWCFLVELPNKLLRWLPNMPSEVSGRTTIHMNINHGISAQQFEPPKHYVRADGSFHVLMVCDHMAANTNLDSTSMYLKYTIKRMMIG